LTINFDLLSRNIASVFDVMQNLLNYLAINVRELRKVADGIVPGCLRAT
jgi:hypothetical protein